MRPRRDLEADLRGRADGTAVDARDFAKTWFRKLPKTVERYVSGLARDGLKEEILAAVEARFRDVGLLAAASRTPG